MVLLWHQILFPTPHPSLHYRCRALKTSRVLPAAFRGWALFNRGHKLDSRAGRPCTERSLEYTHAPDIRQFAYKTIRLRIPGSEIRQSGWPAPAPLSYLGHFFFHFVESLRSSLLVSPLWPKPCPWNPWRKKRLVAHGGPMLPTMGNSTAKQRAGNREDNK